LTCGFWARLETLSSGKRALQKKYVNLTTLLSNLTKSLPERMKITEKYLKISLTKPLGASIERLSDELGLGKDIYKWVDLLEHKCIFV